MPKALNTLGQLKRCSRMQHLLRVAFSLAVVKRNCGKKYKVFRRIKVTG